MFNNLPDFEGIVISGCLLVATLAVSLLAVFTMWLTGVRPDWWMLWVAIGVVVGATGVVLVVNAVRK